MPELVRGEELLDHRQIVPSGGGKGSVHKIMFEEIISVENLLSAWREFLNGKRNKPDVQEFSLRLMDHIFALHRDLVNHTYRHGGYAAFKVADPKPRDIHKACVRDRLLHHAIYRVLYPHFDKKFIADSFSCRGNKGTHRALNRFRVFVWKMGKNNTKQCWVLKCDVKKFFASIDHEVLLRILGRDLDGNTLWLCGNVIESFHAAPGRGLPLGNLTSQFFANVYLNELDRFIKHGLKEKYYIRYADDFVVFSNDKSYLVESIPFIRAFLERALKLSLHKDKLFIQTIGSGVDFLGWVHFPDHRVLRTTTKRRMFRTVKDHPTPETLNSYLGLLGHGNAGKLKKGLTNYFKISDDS